MHLFRIVLAAVLIVSITTMTHAASPKIGDKAPEIKAKKWLTQDPPAIPGSEKAGEHVFVVEFWATWCGPCIKGMPHLAELHTKHSKDGLVILSISAENEQVVSAFVKNNKKNMPYYVAADDATAQVWMESIPGIPHAFIVNKEGIVVWSGNPLGTDAFDSVIEQVLAGKFDIEAAKKAAELDKQFETLMQELQSAYVMHDGDKLFETLDKLIALKPKELQPYLIKRSLLTEFGKEDQIPAWDEVIEKNFSDSLEAMFQMAVNELTLDYSARRADLMLRCARRACELTEWRDHDALALLSRVLCELGMTDLAVKAQTQAMTVAPDENKEYHKKVLAYYEAARKLAKETPADFIKKPAPEKKAEAETEPAPEKKPEGEKKAEGEGKDQAASSGRVIIVSPGKDGIYGTPDDVPNDKILSKWR